MTIEKRVQAFIALGKRLQSLNENTFLEIAQKVQNENPWFTNNNIQRSLTGITKFLEEDSLQKWIKNYSFPDKGKVVALIMAGNIPLVGFHDFLAVLISGNAVNIKLSSKDSVLIKYIAQNLIAIEPSFEDVITFNERLKEFDAVIATGSDNSSRYFEYYFGKYPHIIRKNRTSCALLSGDETDTDFLKLGEDVFSYFGLGCRNVSKLYVPENYNFTPLLKSWESFHDLVNHNKYCNNYDYQKSIMLVNGTTFLDNGCVMITESVQTVSLISVVYYETYKDSLDLKAKINLIDDKLQCVVGSISPATIPFGQAQYPAINDYADNVDTLNFLSTI